MTSLDGKTTLGPNALVSEALQLYKFLQAINASVSGLKGDGSPISLFLPLAAAQSSQQVYPLTNDVDKYIFKRQTQYGVHIRSRLYHKSSKDGSVDVKSEDIAFLAGSHV